MKDEACIACRDGECPTHLGTPSHLGDQGRATELIARVDRMAIKAHAPSIEELGHLTWELRSELESVLAELSALRHQQEQLQQEATRLGRIARNADNRRDRRTGQLRATQERNEQLVAALKAVTEHMDRAGGDGHGMPECPWCRRQDDGSEHNADCELLQARAVLADQGQPV